ncbi:MULTISPECIES: addiction module antidote protein [unclassified Stenotrophomonas]|uniref:addiction module antidote protein n=1 Tax=unclassified Stenotrophomonas TaxID=196198 RepID=UPI001044FEAB|nr:MULTISPECIES: addiction module antidote protein [unclassified Stenotrophomonas]MDV3513719.1 putative addiction module antidote protein [Stenotrophomonas sp. C1657]TDB35419.1 putative addiction module antidote protein [Stenotrophomonas sp. TEPEL]
MNNKVQLHDWDAAEHLRDEEDIAFFIEAALEEAPDDSAFIASVLGIAARARNISDLARSTGIARETLYKMLRGEGNPTMGNLSKLARSLGFRLSLVPVDSNGKPIKAKSKTKPSKTTSKTAKKVA